MKLRSIWSTLVVVSASLIAACTDPEPSPEPQLARDIFAEEGAIRPGATPEQRATFERGRAVTVRRFGKADGLGPQFNVTFCAACHEKPTVGGGAGRYRDFELVAAVLSDQSFNFLGKSGVQVNYALDRSVRVETPTIANVQAQRNPIPFFGVGLLAEIPDREILKRVDPEDRDGDGIRGKANYDRGFVGRFGLKSQTVSIEGFIRGPLFNHAGITSDPLTEEKRALLPVPSAAAGIAPTRSLGPGVAQIAQAQAAAPDAPTTDEDGVPDPELAPDDLFDLVSFAMLLAAPQPDPPTARSEAGRQGFDKAHCTGCHVPSLEGPRGLIPAYSDLLLHDMGPELADGITMKLAGGSDFRTQPLWGVSAVGPYLHDGRADTLDQAVRLHGGEAARSRDAYVALTESEREDILVFLGSLGGSRQRTDGLLPPDAPIPEPASYGGPSASLTAEELARFLSGRSVFDRDFPLSRGIGPRFNGDSCRACHFDPVLGGSGPRDVNVLRQGRVEGGGFTAPIAGTMMHRHASVPGQRPEPEPGTNFFEARQPPAVFGLGLIERIAEADILAREDPEDRDGDGVRGHARRLPDGRLGRLGWKAGVPSLAEFARDAMSNELGITVPAQAGLTFGAGMDADAVPDPEITSEELDALSFFMGHLAPPPRSRKDAPLQDQGELVFGQLKCGGCHVPSWTTADGIRISPYTDLLLHDVAQSGEVGATDGSAGMTEYRTAPLWGLARTAPYMHDGRADSIEQAIAAHDGEARASVTAFSVLSPADRAAVLAFLGSL